MTHESPVTIAETQSICPACFARVPAKLITQQDCVFMRKTCQRHGDFQTLLWRGDPPYETWSRPKIPFLSPHARSEVRNGCPFDCGLCSDHRQQTCTALIEVTSRCNLRCTVCFADSGATSLRDPDMSEIGASYESLLANGYVSNVQLSGGEPTLREDLPEIVTLGRSMGFDFIQLNTNGLRIASDLQYLERLKTAGLSSVFLQFDGTENSVYRELRGGDFFDRKVQVIRNCREMDLGVVLVPTLVPGVNLHNVGVILSFALENLPTVRGVHFQPVTYAGRYPEMPAEGDRLTLPDVMRAIELHTKGMIRIENFSPPGCENALCSFHGSFVAMPDGHVKSLTIRSEEPCSCASEKAEDGAARTRHCVAEQWSAGNALPSSTQGDIPMGQWDVLLERSRTHRLTVSAMAFQDAWNLDLERLKDCCIHVVLQDGRLVPFCAYNLTGAAGRSLYRGK
ncbi:MAG TPA: radical SAM protein [Desulfomonilaceae bacterium]|nr:radical SAM protein [Desulfomonilaceae bacterium]